MATKERSIATVGTVDFYRRAPKQRRSSEKVQRILDTAAQLLDEVPYDEVTARLIAERAGITVPTFYGYFKDRDAVFATLATQYAEEAEAIIDEFTPESFATWEQLVDASIDRYVVWFRERAGFRALWFSGHLNDVLLEVNQRVKDHVVATRRALMEAMLGHRRIPEEVHRFAVEMSDRMLGAGFESDPKGDPRVFAELKVAMRAYLGVYVERAAAARRRARPRRR